RPDERVERRSAGSVDHTVSSVGPGLRSGVFRNGRSYLSAIPTGRTPGTVRTATRDAAARRSLEGCGGGTPPEMLRRRNNAEPGPNHPSVEKGWRIIDRGKRATSLDGPRIRLPCPGHRRNRVGTAPVSLFDRTASAIDVWIEWDDGPAHETIPGAFARGARGRDPFHRGLLPNRFRRAVGGNVAGGAR